MTDYKSQIYQQAVNLVENSKLETILATRVLAIIDYYNDNDVEKLAKIIKGSTEENQTEALQLASMFIEQAETEVEDQIMASGETDEIALLNTIKKARLITLEKYAQELEQSLASQN